MANPSALRAPPLGKGRMYSEKSLAISPSLKRRDFTQNEYYRESVNGYKNLIERFVYKQMRTYYAASNRALFSAIHFPISAFCSSSLFSPAAFITSACADI